MICITSFLFEAESAAALVRTRGTIVLPYTDCIINTDTRQDMKKVKKCLFIMG